MTSHLFSAKIVVHLFSRNLPIYHIMITLSYNVKPVNSQRFVGNVFFFVVSYKYKRRRVFHEYVKWDICIVISFPANLCESQANGHLDQGSRTYGTRKDFLCTWRSLVSHFFFYLFCPTSVHIYTHIRLRKYCV